MDTEALERQLREEGFRHIFVWRDAPRAEHPDHTHPTATAHIVLDGAITVTTAAGSRTYEAGERFDVRADELHSAKAGAQGCTYLVGEKVTARASAPTGQAARER